MITDPGDERLRSYILDYFGEDARIRILRRADTFGAPVFVVDFDRGMRHFRTFGSFGSALQVTEQSSMDLLYPARLVFHYERLLSLALGMTPRPANALLLGLGGGAMLRFIRGYVPDCATTIVEADETVIGLARRWFYLTQPVVHDTAERFLAATAGGFDAVLVDLYDAAGPARSDEGFWGRGLDALSAGGCLAVNWADFAVNPQVRPMAESLAQVARARGLEPIFVTRRGFQDNLVQYVPTAAGTGPEALTEIHERFARERHLPDRGRGILENCIVTTHFPIA